MLKAFPIEGGSGAAAHIERVVRSVLADAQQRGYPLPPSIRIDPAPFRRYGRRAPRIPAQTDPETGEIWINPASHHFRCWKALRKYARRHHAKGYTSTDHPAHV